MAEYTAKWYDQDDNVFRHGEFENVRAAKKFLLDKEFAKNAQVMDEDGEIVWRLEE